MFNYSLVVLITPIKKPTDFQNENQSVKLFILFLVADIRKLFDFFTNFLTLQAENHIARAFEKSDILFPAHSTFAMLQSDKLLFHLPPATRTHLIACSQRITAFHSSSCLFIALLHLF